MAGGLVRDGTVALDHDNNSRLAGGDNMGVMAAPKRLTIGNVAMISSPSELKLLKKCVALAQLLSGATVSVSSRRTGMSLRYRLLLAALLQVLRAIGGLEKALGDTDRYVDLMRLLAHFNFAQATQLLQDGRWGLLVHQKLQQHRQRKYLVIWRGQLRAAQGGFPSAWDDSREVLLKPTETISALGGNHHNPHHPMRAVFSHWRNTLGTRQAEHLRRPSAVAYDATRVAWLFSVWRKWASLKRKLDNYQAYAVPSEEESMAASLMALRSTRARALYLLHEWRGATKLQHRRVNEIIEVKRSAWGAWCSLQQRHQTRHGLAIMYDGTRHLRPTFCSWAAAFTRHAYCWERARDHCAQLVKSHVLEHWQERHQGMTRMRQTLGKWRGITDFYQRNQTIARLFHHRKMVVAFLAHWRGRANGLGIVQQTAERLRTNRIRAHAHLFLTVWRKSLAWITRNGEKMRLMRAARTVRTCIHHWRQWRGNRSIADLVHKGTLLRRIMARWQERLEELQRTRWMKSDVWKAWRRLSVTRRTIRLFTARRLGRGSNALEMLSVARAFLHWHHQSSLNRAVELYEARKQRELWSQILKGWRMDTNVACYLRQRPWRIKKRTLRKLRQQATHSRRDQLEGRLGEHLAGRRFISYYKTFEHWQQLFQARKMEEHLCGQNLIYYQHRQKQVILRCWQLGGARRILQRLKGLRARKQIFASWRRDCSASAQARDQRLAGRLLDRWRRAYREAIVRELRSQSDRKITRLALLHWRQQTGAQQRSHRKSVEFIGQSNVRYMLQKWRTEVALRQALRTHHLYPHPHPHLSPHQQAREREHENQHQHQRGRGRGEYPRNVLEMDNLDGRAHVRRTTLTPPLRSLPPTGPLSKSEFIV